MSIDYRGQYGWDQANMSKSRKITVAYLVVIVEIDPSPQSLDGVPPFRRICHDNGPALGIVLFDAHLLDGAARRKL
jgi:hypothetical protein